MTYKAVYLHDSISLNGQTNQILNCFSSNNLHNLKDIVYFRYIVSYLRKCRTSREAILQEILYDKVPSLRMKDNNESNQYKVHRYNCNDKR